MPRKLSEYTLAEWARLRPLTHAWKTAAGAAVNARYCRLPAPEASDFARASARIHGKNVVATVAWNMPWILRWHIKFVGAHLRGARLVVADNSSDPGAREEIARLCAEADVPYFALPANPYRHIRYASRSHGLALNWTCRNIIAPAKPDVFGFLDHDVMPAAPVDPERLLARQPIYGRLVVRDRRWYLWPGYAFFRSHAAPADALDFRQDWFAGLDTGGMNWSRLFEGIDRSGMTFSRVRTETVDAMSGVADEYEWVDDCLHVTNASEWKRVDDGRVARIEAMLSAWRDGLAATTSSSFARPAPAQERER